MSLRRFIKRSFREKLIIILNYIIGFIMIFTASLECDDWKFVTIQCAVLLCGCAWFALFVYANYKYLNDERW